MGLKDVSDVVTMMLPAAPSIASAPGKAILFGEHAVVRGAPAVVAVINRRTTVRCQPNHGPWLVDGHPFDPVVMPHLGSLFRRLCPQWSPPLCLEIDSEVPMSGGLGSSAALCVAAAAALRACLGRWRCGDEWGSGFSKDADVFGLGPFDDPPLHAPDETWTLIQGSEAVVPDEVMRLAHVAEAEAQRGRASPTDTSASALGGLIVVNPPDVHELSHLTHRTLSVDGAIQNWDLHRLTWDGAPLSCWFVDTGPAPSRSEMVELVNECVSGHSEASAAMNRMSDLGAAGIQAFLEGDVAAIGQIMDDQQDCLRTFGASTDIIDRCLENVGPFVRGGKLTGAGGGGHVILIPEDENRLAEVLQNMNLPWFEASLGGEGLRVA